ncbi:MAG: 4-(cytidine 5'-diphospho)-2-C-methyl-D-erythritol kinase [Alphaproteobacteria bacterium]|nr:4-(cytidine 5'-diphospho)-2-C-methyl-D-erythritol kinase [Alphaproteobacteria bacterium]
MAWVGKAHARAKINLTLHILGRRDDGYHDLESLVTFAAFGDELTLVEGPQLALTLSGPQSAALKNDGDNHILKAAQALNARVKNLRIGKFHLVKSLPLASGMGGGSADAAAALRLLAKLNHLSLDDQRVREAALETGADVSVCLESRSRMMWGIGETLDAPIALPKLFALVVNPLKTSATPDVFAKIGLARGVLHKAPPHPCFTDKMSEHSFFSALEAGRNDMETAAITLQPAIGDVQKAVSSLPACRLTRMSGSGATVFGLFPSCRAAATAARLLKREHPEWWIKPTLFG